MATTAMTLLGIFRFRLGTFLLGIVRFANHFRLAMTPDHRHPLFGITNMTNFVREIGVRLTLQRQQFRSKREVFEDIKMKESATLGYRKTTRFCTPIKEGQKTSSNKCRPRSHHEAASQLCMEGPSIAYVPYACFRTPRSAPHFTTNLVSNRL